MTSNPINDITGEISIPESDTLNNISSVRKSRRHTPPLRRENSLDLLEQQELDLPKGYITYLLEECGLMITCLSTLYVQWYVIEQNDYTNPDEDWACQAIILAIELQQADMQEIDMEINMVVDIEMQIKSYFCS